MGASPVLHARSFRLQTLPLVDSEARGTTEVLSIIRAAIFRHDSPSASLSIANPRHSQTLQSQGATSCGANTAHLLNSESSRTVIRSAKTCCSVPGPAGVLTFRPRNGKSHACDCPNLDLLASIRSRSPRSATNGGSTPSHGTSLLEARGVSPRSVSIFE